MMIPDLTPDADLVIDLELDSLAMLELFDILEESLLGPKAQLEFDTETLDTTVRGIYLKCLTALQKPFKEPLQSIRKPVMRLQTPETKNTTLPRSYPKHR